mmetsp:Transcript_16044/g.24903  ORF Transcript_16044/g.24903 Transcript_16044/m.24903 type:complete len:87 (-) Transcript_16044:81-341(-)|eukprot:CAMPEP_0170488504 /NCGR_PEP_ID=MMETSP0208-20121228/7057_1 /TAXON_ID=197538 /ORGANISM="Strombidium inclinatum, Strain S3" /LENGTH=86 /DNA_ID=CAMNT_0010763109 /DNA_START=303 /DNA_END=563 /DNA_ORIENTATION=-
MKAPIVLSSPQITAPQIPGKTSKNLKPPGLSQAVPVYNSSSSNSTRRVVIKQSKHDDTLSQILEKEVQDETSQVFNLDAGTAQAST